MKKIALIILAAAIAVSFGFSAAAFAAFTAFNSADAPYGPVSADALAAQAAIESRNYTAEICHNDLLLAGGDTLRNITFWVDANKLTSGLTAAEKTARENLIKEKLDAVNDLFKDNYEVDYDNNFIEVTLEYYESYTDMYIAYGYDGYDTGDGKNDTDTGFFFNTYTSKRDTVFARLNPDSLLTEAIELMEAIEGVGEDGITYIYNYGTKYGKGLINSDADNIYLNRQLKIYIHSYVMNKDNLGRTVTLTQTAPNAVTWYSLTIGLTAIFAGVFIAIAVIDNKKKKKKSGDV